MLRAALSTQSLGLQAQSGQCHPRNERLYRISNKDRCPSPLTRPPRSTATPRRRSASVGDPSMMQRKRKPGRVSEESQPAASGKIVKRIRKSRPSSGNNADKVVLERVLGLTTTNTASLACCQAKGIVAYSAGCAVVLYYPRKNRQHHIISPARKPISCLAFSQDGSHLCTGESGHQPAVRVWELSENPTQVQELPGHRFGISMVAFSPKGKYLVSVGYEHDMTVIVWKWRAAQQLATNKISTKVTALSFSHDGSYFVTAGNRHIRFWYLDTSSKVSKAQPLQGRSAVLGEHRGLNFVGVACGDDRTSFATYAVTTNGLLMQFSQERRMEKFVSLNTPTALSVTVGQHLFCGCVDGVVRVFDPLSLSYISSLPNPHPLGVDVASIMDTSALLESTDGKSKLTFPDVGALTLDSPNNRLTCIYSDRSMYVWDISNVQKVGKTRSFLYHPSTIWDIEMYPEASNDSPSLLPPGTFITAGADNTIRLWNVGNETSSVFRNIYSKELIRIIDVSKDQQPDDVPDGDAAGIRTIKVSPDGQRLASGDRSGNLRIHDLQFFDEAVIVLAHDADILSLNYSQPRVSGDYLLASSGRDRLVHVFDTTKYDLLQTLDEHSAAVTDTKFANSGDSIGLVSCSNDKSVMFRTVQEESFVCTHHVAGKSSCQSMALTNDRKAIVAACQDRLLRLYDVETGKCTRSIKLSSNDTGSLGKVVLDPSGTVLATCGSDRCIHLVDLSSGETLACLHGHSDAITGMKFTLDCLRLISVSADGCIFIWRMSKMLGEMMQEKLMDQRRASGVYAPLVQSTLALASPCPTPMRSSSRTAADNTFTVFASVEGEEAPAAAAPEQPFPVAGSDVGRFSIGRLPGWAHDQLHGAARGSGEASSVPSRGPKSTTLPRALTKWAQRVDLSAGLTVASELEGDDGVLHVEDAWSGSRPRLSSAGITQSPLPSPRQASERIHCADDDGEALQSGAASEENPTAVEVNASVPAADKTWVVSGESGHGDASANVEPVLDAEYDDDDDDEEEDEEDADEDTTIYLPNIAESAAILPDFQVTQSVQAGSSMDDSCDVEESISSPPTPVEDSPKGEKALGPISMDLDFQPMDARLADSVFGSSEASDLPADIMITSRQNAAPSVFPQRHRRLSISARFLARSKQTTTGPSNLRQRPVDLKALTETSPAGVTSPKSVLSPVTTRPLSAGESSNSSGSRGSLTSRTSERSPQTPSRPVGARVRKNVQSPRSVPYSKHPLSPSPYADLTPQRRSVSTPSLAPQVSCPVEFTQTSPQSGSRRSRTGLGGAGLKTAGSDSALGRGVYPGDTLQSQADFQRDDLTGCIGREQESSPLSRCVGASAQPAAVTSSPLACRVEGGDMDMSVCMKVLENLEDSFNMAVSHYTEIKAEDDTTPEVPRNDQLSGLLEHYSGVFTRMSSRLAELGAATTVPVGTELRSPSTTALLERYSDALCAMVQEKLREQDTAVNSSDITVCARPTEKTAP